MKYGVLIGRHSALSVCQQNGAAVMSESSTMEAVGAVLKAGSARLFKKFSSPTSCVQTYRRTICLAL